MIKVIPPDSQNFDEPMAQFIKMSSDGIRGSDLKSFIKRAGHEFVDAIKNIKFDKGEVPIHLIALGATEYYGPNRNGDGFKVATCKKYHHTFVKHARFYRNHINKNPEKSYGIVKYSYYNDSMHRIELLVALNGDKKAAEKNGGLVADLELEKLANGKDIGVSMACYVPFDVCSVCGNKAKSRKDYCRGFDEGGKCPGGGLFTKIATVLADGTQVYADNPNPKFFDISHVPRPADRIAWVMGQLKEAGDHREIIGGAELAERLNLRDESITQPEIIVSNNENTSFYNALKKLAEAERKILTQKKSNLNLAFMPEVQPLIDWSEINTLNVDQAVGGLTREKVAMPLGGFLHAISNLIVPENVYVQSKLSLPGIYGRIIKSANLDGWLNCAKQWSDLCRQPSNQMKLWVTKVSQDYSLNRNQVYRRIKKASLYYPTPPSIQSSFIKLGSLGKDAEQIAKLYALYKVAFIRNNLDDADLDLLCELTVRQDYF